MLNFKIYNEVFSDCSSGNWDGDLNVATLLTPFVFIGCSAIVGVDYRGSGFGFGFFLEGGGRGRLMRLLMNLGFGFWNGRRGGDLLLLWFFNGLCLSLFLLRFFTCLFILLEFFLVDLWVLLREAFVVFVLEMLENREKLNYNCLTICVLTPGGNPIVSPGSAS